MRTRFVRRSFVALILGLSLVPAGVALVVASNYGIEIESEACSSTIRSECGANNYLHNVWVATPFSSSLLASLDASITDDLDATRDIVARRVTSETDNDVRAFDNDYGDTSWAAYTTCPVWATFGGTGEGRWCRPQLLYFNNGPSWAYRYDSVGERGHLTCHELGHTMGLRHARSDSHPDYADSPPPCMRSGAWNGVNLFPHDRELLNSNY